ncbi:MAG: hypothetical protein RLY82_779 [Pseudomonadota bacterium]
MAAQIAALKISSAPHNTCASKTAAPSHMADKLAKIISMSITKDVVLDFSLDAPYWSAKFPNKKTAPIPSTASAKDHEKFGKEGTTCAHEPKTPTINAMIAPPANMANRREISVV